jgi:predicted DNA-binding transcriptional regulator AlpA
VDTQIDPLLTEDEAAQLLGVSGEHLARLRRKGAGPIPVHVGDGARAVVRYRSSALRAWIESREVPRG